MEGESMVPSTVRIVHLVYVCTFGARLRMRARERRRREEERLHQRVGGSLSQQDQRQALHVFGETASVRAESIHELRKAMRIVVEAQEADDWRDVQVASEQSEAWLLRFVRFTRFDVQRALETLRAGMAHARYLETLPYRTGGQFVVQGEAESPPPRVSFWELSLGHPAVEHVTRAGIVQLVPGRARDGSAVVLLTLSNAFLEAWQIYPVGVFTLAVDKCLELVSLDEVSQLYGLTVVLDMRRASLKLMSVSARADMLRMTEKRLAVLSGKSGFRVVGLWLVGAPWYARVLISTVKAFMPEKIRQRLHAIGSVAELHKHVEPKILPPSVGGSGCGNGNGSAEATMSFEECLKIVSATVAAPPPCGAGGREQQLRTSNPGALIVQSVELQHT